MLHRNHKVNDQPAHSAAALRERLAPAVEHGLQTAEQAAEQALAWAAPRVEAARTWAAPRLERGLERGLEAAVPRVEAAADRVAPAVDAARDRIVDDLLPRLVEAVQAAAATAAAAAAVREAAELEATGTEPDGARRRRHPLLRRLLLAGAVGAGLAAGLAAWRRGRRDQHAWGNDDATGVAASQAPVFDPGLGDEQTPDSRSPTYAFPGETPVGQTGDSQPGNVVVDVTAAEAAGDATGPADGAHAGGEEGAGDAANGEPVGDAAASDPDSAGPGPEGGTGRRRRRG